MRNFSLSIHDYSDEKNGINSKPLLLAIWLFLLHPGEKELISARFGERNHGTSANAANGRIEF